MAVFLRPDASNCDEETVAFLHFLAKVLLVFLQIYFHIQKTASLSKLSWQV